MKMETACRVVALVHSEKSWLRMVFRASITLRKSKSNGARIMKPNFRAPMADAFYANGFATARTTVTMGLMSTSAEKHVLRRKHALPIRSCAIPQSVVFRDNTHATAIMTAEILAMRIRNIAMEERDPHAPLANSNAKTAGVFLNNGNVILTMTAATALMKLWTCA